MAGLYRIPWAKITYVPDETWIVLLATVDKRHEELIHYKDKLVELTDWFGEGHIWASLCRVNKTNKER